MVPPRRPGMMDVAKLAQVSHQTVSRVLNNHPSVRAETRQRVEAAIAELGYRRNALARALVTNRSGLIGVVSSGSPLSGPAGTLGAVEQASRAAGYLVTVAVTPDPDAGAMAKVVAAFETQAVEGAVVIAPTAAVADAAHVLAEQVPVVVITSDQRRSDSYVSVGIDQAQGARLVVDHFIQRGYQDVVHLSGPHAWFDAVARSSGWHERLAEHGITPRPDLHGDWHSDAGYAAGQALLADLPEAVFAGNDQMALGLLHAFAEAGVKVPEQVAVVGFDDIAGSAHFIPPLTTVRQDLSTLGQHAVEVLLAHMRGESPAKTREGADLIVPELIERASS